MSKKSIRKENKRKAELKLLSSALAFGLMFVDPAKAALEHNITRSGSDTPLAPDGNKVTNIYADRKSGTVGINRFSTFNVGNGHVANMHFKQGSSAGETVDKLVNLVDSKINVDGVVNGVKNGKIDGDLFFLSKDGMAVGKTGRINAGSLTVLTPTQAEMDAMTNDDTVADKIANPDGIALNKSGTITVAGKISTKGSVKLRAGKVAVGRDANGKAVAGAAIETGVADFGSLVNLDGAGEAVRSGLENLTASAMADGTITLASMNADENGAAQTATLKNATKLVSAAGTGGKVALKGYKGSDSAELPLDALDKKNVTYDLAGVAPTTARRGSVSKTKIGTTEHDEGTVSLYAQRKASGGNIAVSNYEHFEVKQGDTVNLFYRKSADDTDAGYLVNLVDNKILIDGAVNGVLKNGNTGGKLFFLSSNGMAVGANGTINAGSVGLLMPSWAEMQVLRISSDATDFAKYTTDLDFNSIPVAANGAISVAGKVNADDDITMFGSEITVDGELTAGGSIALSVVAPLRSGWLDGQSGTAADIVHEVLGSAESLTWAVDFLADIFGTAADAIQTAIQQAEQALDPNAQVTATRNVSLGISTADLENILGLMTGEYAAYSAKVNVGTGAKLTAGGAVNISAMAENRVPTALTKVESIVDIYGSVQASSVNVGAVATARSAAGFMPNLKTDVTAKVNIGAGAQIKATGAAGDDGTGGGVTLKAEASALGGLTVEELSDAVESGTLGEYDTANGQRFVSNLVAEVNVANGNAMITSEHGDVTLKADTRSGLSASALDEAMDAVQQQAIQALQDAAAAKQAGAETAPVPEFSTEQLGIDPGAQFATTAAKVNVGTGAKLSAGGDITLDAYSENNYTDLGETYTGSAWNAIPLIGSSLPALPALSFAHETNTAEVTVDTDASLTAGGDVNIDANAVMYVSEGATMRISRGRILSSLLGKKGNTLNNIPLAAATYTGADNRATVTINGAVKAENDISVNATATQNVESVTELVQNPGANGSTNFAFAFSYNNIDNNAEITVGQSSAMTAGDDLVIRSRADDDTSVEVKNSAGAKAALILALNIADVESYASTTINGSLTAHDSDRNDDTNTIVNFFGRELTSPTGGLIVDAEHTSQRVIAATDSSVGRIVPFFKAFTVSVPKTAAVGNAKGIGGNLAAIFKGALGKKGGGNGGSSSGSNDSKGLLNQILGFKLDEKLTGGLAGTFADVDLGAAVKIGSAAKLTSNGDMTINADSVIADTNLQTTGASRSIANENATVNAAAQVALFDNTATVTIETGESDKTLSAAGNMNIAANAFKDYGRVRSMVTKVLSSYNQLYSDWQNIVAMYEAISKYGFADFAEGVLEKTVADNLANVKESFDSLLTTIQALKEKVEGIAVTASDLSQTSTWEALGAGENIEEVAGNVPQTIIGLCLKALQDVATISEGITTIEDAFTQATTVDTSAIQAVVAPFTSTASSAVALLTSGLDFVSPGNYSDFFVTTKANDASKVYNTTSAGDLQEAEEGAAAKISAGGNLNVSTMNNVGIVSIGKRSLTADADLNVAANTESASVTLAGLQLLLFNSKSEGGSAIAGTLNFQNSDLDSIVTIADGASLTAGNASDSKLAVKATGDNELYEIAMSAGKGANAFSGALSFMWGHGNNVVAIDDGVALNAPSIEVLSSGNTIAAEFVGGLGLGSSTASAGASIAVNAFSTNTVASVANAADTLALVYGSKDENNDDVYELADDDTVAGRTVSSLLQGNDTGDAGAITTDALSVKAHNTGAIATLTVAGAVATPGDNADNSDPNKPTSKFGYVKNALMLGTAGGREKAGVALANKLFGEGSILGNVTEKLRDLTTVNTGSSSQKDSDSASLSGVSGNSGLDAANGGFDDGTTKFSISAAGSATVNVMQNNTIARVDHVNITKKTQAPALDVVAVDAALNVGASGALAVNWQKKMTTGGLKKKFGLNDPEKANQFMAYLSSQNISPNSGQTDTNTTNVGVGGAVSVTYLDSDVRAEASRVEMPEARDVNVRALTAGAQVAAGVGVAVAKSEGESGNAIGAAVGVTVNIVNHDVDAILKDSTIGSAAEHGNINVRAIAADLQFSGGISAEIAKSGSGGVSVAAGGSVVASNIVNDLNAQVDGGAYVVGDMNVEAVDALVMVSAAANVGVAAGKSGAALGLALVYDGAFNTINASIGGTTSIAADGAVSVNAHDQGLIGTINSDFMHDIFSDVTTHAHILKSLGLDIGITYGDNDVEEADSFKTDESAPSVTGVTAGSAYYSELDTAGSMAQDNGDGTSDEYTLASQSSYEDENGQEQSAASLNLNEKDKSGSIIISAAVAVDVSTGESSPALGASVGVNVIDNTFTSGIGSNVTINTAGNVVSTADSDSFIIGVSGGAAVSAKSFGGAGSVTVNYLGADVRSDLNGTINAAAVTSQATNDAVMVDVVGQVAFGKKAAAGAAIGVQVLNNSTEALMGGTISAGTANVSAKSDADVYTLAAALGLSPQGNVALSGAVAVSQGKNDTRAVLSNSTLNDLQELNVSAEDGSAIVSGVIGVAASKGASISGGVAYTGIGGIGGHQEVAAMIDNTELNTVDKNGESAQVIVAAADRSTNVAVAIGASVGSNVAVGGAGATSNVYKDAKASMHNSRTGNGAQAPVIKISSDSRSINVTTAFAVSGSKSTAVGAGAAVGNINAGALTEVKNDDNQAYNVEDFSASSTSKQTIVTVGIGAAAAKTAGVAGNIAVNLIGNDTKAALDGATITSARNIAVLSYSRDRIINFGGALGIAAGGNAGVGMSVAYNQISGSTQSVVTNSALSATNAGSVAVRRSYLEDVTDAGDAALALVMAHRPQEQEKNVSGIVVAADAQHDLNSISISAGIGVGSDVGVGVAGNIVVNRIAGETKAAIDDTSAENNQGNVSVWANDATTAVSHLGTASVGIGGGTAGAAVGATSGTVALNRDVIARIDGGTAQKKFNAGTIDVDAQNRASAVSSGAGIAATFGLYGSGAASGTVGVVVVGSKTEAAVDHIDSTNSGLTINAEHSGYVGNYSAAAAVSGAIGTGAVGAGIGVVVDTGETNAKLTNSTINSGSGNVTITADNRTKVDSVVAALAAAAGIGAAGGVNFNVNVLNSKVMTTVGDSTVSTTGTFKALSNNKIETEFISATATAGAVGIGVGIGVGVVNTGVVTDIAGSTISAGTIDIDATETLDVDTDVAQASIGGAGFNANVSVLSIGTATQQTFGGNDDGNDKVEMETILGYVNGGTDFDGSNNSTDDNGNSTTMVGGFAAENNLDLASGGTVDDGTTASQSASGLQISIRNSTLTAAQDVAIDAQKTNDADLFAVQATISSTTGIGVSIADLNVRNKVGITLDNSSIGAKSVAVGANLGGSSNLESYQGALGGTIAVNAAYSRVKTAGAVSVNVKDTNIAAAAGNGNFGSVAISAGDTSKATVRSVGAAVGNIAAGVIAVQSINDSETEIKFKSTKNSAITATGGWGGSITVVSSKNNDVEATAGGGALGLTSGVGLGAEAEDNGESRIAIEGSKYTFKSTAAYFQATNHAAGARSGRQRRGGAHGAPGLRVGRRRQGESSTQRRIRQHVPDGQPELCISGRRRQRQQPDGLRQNRRRRRQHVWERQLAGSARAHRNAERRKRRRPDL